ncbi:hypothetical protein V8G54_025569 [Vigna mungo]|uniref:Uncharacterized protein n=1 Tax=Vigna mungo TaxID=3915 RepID=A0AAQ3MYZ9_VIGMU
MAALIEFITFSCPFRLVINSNFAGTKVSTLMLRAVSPQSFSLGSFLVKAIPLVVMDSVLSPFKFDNSKHMSSISFLTVGSPPVRRILVTPELTNRFANRRISVFVKI